MGEGLITPWLAEFRELTSGNAATSLEYGRSQREDVTQVKECGDIWTKKWWQRVWSKQCAAFSYTTPQPLILNLV